MPRDGAKVEAGGRERCEAEHKAQPRREWYGAFADVEDVLRLYLKDECKEARILHLGCGTSTLAQELWKKGWTNVTNVDYSEAAVARARERDRHLHGIKYACMDCTDMSALPDASFDYIIDKGCLDAVFCSLGCIYRVPRVLDEVSRLLKPGGYFLSISDAPRDCRFPHLQRPRLDWSVDVVRVPHDPGFFCFACKKRSYHREWFFPDPGALTVRESAKTVYVPPVRLLHAKRRS